MTLALATIREVGLATVQDGGRFGYQRIGVPQAGVLHRSRYLVAAALLTGSPDDRVPALEILAGSLELLARHALAVAVVGPARVVVDGRAAANGTVVEVPDGSSLAVQRDGRGPVYCVVGGWAPPRILGSASVDTFSGLGGRPLRVGDVLTGDPSALPERVGTFHLRAHDPSGPLRVIPGVPGTRLLSSRWTVLNTARSGVRLAASTPTAVLEPVASMPVLPGAIQATPSGEAIILGPDGALTGGYPVVGVVISADLDRVSLLEAGDLVGFAESGVDEAAEAYAQAQRALRARMAHPADLP